MKIPRNIRRCKTCANYVNTHDKKPPKNSSKKKHRMSYGYKCRNNNAFNFFEFVKMKNFGLQNKFIVILSSNNFLNHADENVAFFWGNSNNLYNMKINFSLSFLVIFNHQFIHLVKTFVSQTLIYDLNFHSNGNDFEHQYANKKNPRGFSIKITSFSNFFFEFRNH